jgi:hypothetical protein
MAREDKDGSGIGVEVMTMSPVVFGLAFWESKKRRTEPSDSR